MKEHKNFPVDEQNATKGDNFDEVDAFIVGRILHSPAVTDLELANSLGVSRQTVNRRRNSSEVRRSIKDQLSLSEHEVRRLTLKSFKRLESLIDHEDPRIQVAASSIFIRLAAKLISPANPFEYNADEFRI